MNAEHFYAEFKHALKCLLLNWGEMGAAKVTIEGGFLVFENDGRKASFRVPEKRPKSTKKAVKK